MGIAFYLDKDEGIKWQITVVTAPTQPNITKVGLDMKMTLHHHHHRKFNVGYISAVTDPISTKL